MPIQYKIDVLNALKTAGYSTYKMRQHKIFAESVLQQFRKGEIVSTEQLGKLCKLLKCQPGDILEYSDDEAAPISEKAGAEKAADR